jgi:hypothetical protein
MFAARPAHLDGRLQSAAKRRPFRFAENAAQVVVPELDAPLAGRLAIGHSGDGTGDRRGGAAGAATKAAGECGFWSVHRLRIGRGGYAAASPYFTPVHRHDPQRQTPNFFLHENGVADVALL